MHQSGEGQEQRTARRQGQRTHPANKGSNDGDHKGELQHHHPPPGINAITGRETFIDCIIEQCDCDECSLLSASEKDVDLQVSQDLAAVSGMWQLCKAVPVPVLMTATRPARRPTAPCIVVPYIPMFVPSMEHIHQTSLRVSRLCTCAARAVHTARRSRRSPSGPPVARDSLWLIWEAP